MAHRLSVPFPFLPLIDDDDQFPPDNPQPTPRSCFPLCLDPSDSLCGSDLRRRPHSLFSVDSGYFSIMGKESPISKPFSRKSSTADLRPPLAPVSSNTDATQESPKREGVVRNLLRKKKKSFIPPCPTDLDPFMPSTSHATPLDDPVPRRQPRSFSLSSSRSSLRNSLLDAFEERDHFIVRRGMKHHPYPRDEAPYMLAYDRTLLDNDKFSEILLRRLNRNHSPSFHDFSHAPPKTILDLGCGPGAWAVDAAEFWPTSQVIGFDLLDPARLRGGIESPINVRWKQGNFVKYKLPFPKNMFDLVRMANLSLCVPYDRWEHVLSEVRRVLAHGGRLELIDDYLHFPYTKRSPQPSTDPVTHVRPPSSSFDDVVDDGIEEGMDTEHRDGIGDDNPHGSNRNKHDNDVDDDEDNDEDFVSTKSRFSTVLDADDFPPLPSYDPVTEWNRNVDDSKSLEKLFEDMLWRKFSIHPRPSKFLDNVIDEVFGRYNQCRLHEFNLYLAPPSSQDSDDSSIGSSESHGSASLKKASKDFAKWVANVDWDLHKEKERKQRTKGDRSSAESNYSLSMVPDVISAKAAGRLGIKPPPPQSSHPAQSPGLILWPSTFIPIAPLELEMHVCKHLHSLIGCKAALAEFMQDVALEQKLPFDQQMVDDLVWDYESFRRKRFNWPSECPDPIPEASVPLATSPRSNTFRNSLEASPQTRPHTSSGVMSPPPDPLFPREKLDFVRSIRVYSAAKNDEEAHVL